jgi:hypothetical protein
MKLHFNANKGGTDLDDIKKRKIVVEVVAWQQLRVQPQIWDVLVFRDSDGSNIASLVLLSRKRGRLGTREVSLVR